MNQPLSRRHFLSTSAAGDSALAAGPLLAQAGSLPSQRVIVGIMGLNRGMQVAAALEKQPGVVIKYVCDVDAKRGDQAKAQLRPLALKKFNAAADTDGTPFSKTDRAGHTTGQWREGGAGDPIEIA